MRKAVVSMVILLVIIVGVSLLWHPATNTTPKGRQGNVNVQSSSAPAKASPKVNTLSEAIKSGDYKSCSNVAPELRQGCIDRIVKVKAISALNLSMCDGIKTGFIKDDCVNSIKSRIQASKPKYDFSRCDNVNEADKEVCESNVITSLAEKEAKIELCNDVPVKGLDQACRDNVYIALAIRTGDKSYCDKIVDNGKRASCMG